ncbi:MAG: ABC transporter permease [Hyphomicrobium sp.]|nr:ABC transporter permease [Hyphomicrobium sp.]
MSGSYDNPSGRPRPGGYPPPADPAYDLGGYDDPVTGSPNPRDAYGTQNYGTQNYGTQPDPRDADLRGTYSYDSTLTPDPRPEPPARSRKTKRNKSQLHAPIVPPGRVTGSSLTLVVSIMCFLACLTVGAVYLVNISADGWLRDIASEVTVQIEPRENVDTEVTANDVAKFVGSQPGVVNARVLSLEDATALLEPWLGKSDALKALPVPRLIAVELDRALTPDIDKVKSDVEQRFPGVTLDDHRQWQRQIRTVTRSLALGGIAILALVAAATTAIIISATKSSMASNREIVEVLHFVGATDRFIAHEFEKHFLRLGIRAGFVGAACAAFVFLAMPAITAVLGGGPIATAELQRLIGSGSLDVAGFVLLGIVVVIVAALCMLTSRYGVYSILNQRK